LSFILYALLTALIIGFLTFIHEFGHFFFARLFGVPILEFAIGMGPTVFSWKGKTGTKYALRAFPIGGFVQMDGEEGTSENPNAYNNLSPWKKIAVTGAGPAVNIIFAILLMFALVLSTPELGSTTIGMFDENSVSNSYLQEKDEIVKVGNVKVHTWSEVVYEITMQGYEAIDITVIRDGKKIVIEDVIFDVVAESGLEVGVVDFIPYALSALDDVTIFDYLYQAFYRSINTVKTVFDSIGMLISGRAGMDAVSGPVGLVGAVDQVVSYGFASLVNFVVLISMNLGIFNLLPIPALDGGRILFHLIDGIAGRKVIKKEIEETITGVTMILLLAFMLFVSVKDVINLF
jgi:regulator of sigma E protease